MTAQNTKCDHSCNKTYANHFRCISMSDDEENKTRHIFYYKILQIKMFGK